MYCNFFAVGCVTLGCFIIWKTVLLEKLRYFENCDIWKTALLWKTDFVLNNYVTWKTALGCVTCKILRWGALLLKIFTVINVALFKRNDFIWKLRFLENCVTLKNCGTSELVLWKTVVLENCYAGKLWY